MSNYEDNPFESPETDLAIKKKPRKKRTLEYASFWHRFVAAVVDGFICSICSGLIGMFVGLAMVATDNVSPEGGLGVVVSIFLQLFGVVFQWLYFVIQESSEAQATLGKRMIGIKVTDLDGHRVSFGRATGRYFAKILSVFTLAVGYLIQPFTEKKQAMHDILAGCLVVRS